MSTQTVEIEHPLAIARDQANEWALSRERRIEAAAAILFALAAVAMAAMVPADRPLELPTAALLLGGYLIACRIRFDTPGGGCTAPTGVVLVPMLFLLPTPVVPLLAGIGWLLNRLVDRARGEPDADPEFRALRHSWHALGPAIVLCAAGAETFAWNEWPVYALALGAQFAFDFAAGSSLGRLLDGTPPGEQARRIGPAYALDAALAAIGLLGAYAAVAVGPALALLALPLCSVIAMLARERRARLDEALDMSDAYRGTALLLGDVVEADDAYTGSNSRGVVEIALAVADRLGLDATQRRDLEFGALLHNVGKIAVPKEIIHRAGPLNAAEWKIMRRQTVEGERMLDRVGGVLAEVSRVVRSSHERFDGSGYPDGLAGEEIPIESRIISCCDAYSAMTTTRAYREAMTVEAALAELRRGAGKQFDPVVAAALTDLLEASG